MYGSVTGPLSNAWRVWESQPYRTTAMLRKLRTRETRVAATRADPLGVHAP